MSQEDINDDESYMYCICPNCGKSTPLEQENAQCEDQECQFCGFPATLDIVDGDQYEENQYIDSQTFNRIGNKIGKILKENQEILNKKDFKEYKCPTCQTIMSNELFEHELGCCVSCGEKLVGFYEGHDLTEKRSVCINCKTSYLYENTLGSCKACGGLLQVFAPIKYVSENIYNINNEI